MGDRGNIKIVDRDGTAVYVYGHWWGSDLPMLAQKALRAADLTDAHGNRWDDAPYLATFVVRQMDDPTDKWPGCAISTKIVDNEYPIIVLDTRDQRVHLMDYEWDSRTLTDRVNSWSMKEVAASDDPARLIEFSDE